MDFPNNLNLLFSDTLIPDVFLNEYLPNMTSEQVKVYLYVSFLHGKSRKILVKDLVSKLGFSYEEMQRILLELESLGLLVSKIGRVSLLDVKEKEILKHFNVKLDVSAEKVSESETNKKRIQTVDMINSKFFQGIMSTSFLNAVYSWFEEYKFEEDVMFALFQYCYERGKLNVPYVSAVAKGWFSEGIVTGVELDSYFIKRKKYDDVVSKIRRNLKMYNDLTEAQSELVEKWVNVYKYNYDIIKEALKRSSNKLNAGLEYYDKILTEWYNHGLTSVDEIVAYEHELKAKNISHGGRGNGNNNSSNTSKQHIASETRKSLAKRGYDDKFVKGLYEN